MARDATELVNFLDESTRKRKRIAEQLEAVSVAASSVGPSADIECTENDISLNETTSGNDTLGLGESKIQISKKTKGPNLNNSLVERISPKYGDNSANVVENVLTSANRYAYSKSSDRKGISLAAVKVARTTGEKLWDGSLQLNSSVTLSTVAFFKSGEKMHDLKWSDIAEVIGKVRLDDLERYIRDISRSRNRGLMVISLCWKEGSSISGLADMKKVAKCYQEEERVGFVKLSPGVDLYVCPCSDTMITILAKHGFFKGMYAVVDNKDSLIGCVVRRKNGASTSSAPMKSDSMNGSLPEQSLNSTFGSSNQKSPEKDLSREQPIQKAIPIARETELSTLESKGDSGNEGKSLNSTFGSSNQKSTEKVLSSEKPIQKSVPIARETECSTRESKGDSGNEAKYLNSTFGSSNQKSTERDLSREQPIQKSVPIARETERSTLESKGDSGNEGKHLKSSEVQLRLCNSSARANSFLTSSILRPEIFSTSNCSIDASSLKGSMPQSSEVESPPIHKSSMQKTEMSLASQKPVSSLPSGVPEQSMPTLDDLPEFNFRTSCGVYQTPRSINAVTVGKKPLTEGSTKMDGSVQPTVPTLVLPSTFSKQRSENFNRTMFPLNETQRMPLLKEVSEHEEPQTAQSSGVRRPFTATAVNSKKFLDDSDMPEWRPPNVELCRLSVPWVSCTSTTSIPLKLPNSTTSIPLKVPNTVFGDFSFSHPKPSLVVSRMASPSVTSSPLKVPNRVFGDFSFSHAKPLLVASQVASPSITSSPLKVPNSTVRSSFSNLRPSASVPQIKFSPITSVPLKVSNSTSGSFSFGSPRPSLCLPRINSPSIASSPLKVPNPTHPHSSNHAQPRANYCSTDPTMKAVPPRLPGGYVQRVPGSSMVFGANTLLRPPPNPFAFRPPVNPAGWRG